LAYQSYLALIFSFRSRIYIIICFGASICCEFPQKKNPLPGYRTESFFLQDSAFHVQLDVPVELDSFYSWLDRSDTECASKRKYRFSDSRYPVRTESGFFHGKEDLADSSYRLTFCHTRNFSCAYDSEEPADVELIIDRRKLISQADSVPLEIYKFENLEINGVLFFVDRYRTGGTLGQKYLVTFVNAFAVFDGIGISVSYECVSKNCNGFIDRMDESLNTLRITPNYELINRKFPRRHD
jgi:hypothetical protein